MKKTFLILAAAVVLSSLAFANEKLSDSDCREAIFGNSYANISEIHDGGLLNAWKNSVIMLYYRGRYKDFHLYEERYGEQTVYRFVASDMPLTYDNAVRGFSGEFFRLWQAVFIKKNGRIYELSAGNIIEYASGDGTVRCWSEMRYGGTEVIRRGNKILGLLTHNAASRKTEHLSDGDDGHIFTTYEKEISAVFYFWQDLLDESYFEEDDDGIFRLKQDRGLVEIPHISISCSFPLIEPKRPFKYTVQNAFDGDSATRFVEDTEDDKIFVDLYVPESLGGCKKIKVINGYAQSESLYMSNNRIRTIAPASDWHPATLKDGTLEPQTFDWNDFECYAKDLYKGRKYSDTCLAELDFMLDNGKWLFGE